MSEFDENRIIRLELAKGAIARDIYNGVVVEIINKQTGKIGGQRFNFIEHIMSPESNVISWGSKDNSWHWVGTPPNNDFLNSLHSEIKNWLDIWK